MTLNSWLQLIAYLMILIGLAWPLGIYISRVFERESLPVIERLLGPLEQLIYRALGVNPDKEMGWKRYMLVLLLINGAGFLTLYLLLRLQGSLPLNPREFPGLDPDTAFNVASSFVSNTNWQNYGGETTLSYFSQLGGLTVQNFLSAATGMAALAALCRGLARRRASTVGNAWVDLTRSILYVLLPLSVVLGIVLVSQGVVQNLDDYRKVELIQPITLRDGTQVTEQTLPMGPAASQVAIKQLGTNGGGFFNANSAHPFENPTPVTNLAEMLAILLIPAAQCFMFGKIIGDQRQGIALLTTMTIVFVAFTVLAITSEQAGNPRLDALPLMSEATSMTAGGNMEGKETRFGITDSTLWATATTAASNGSVNSMHDSYLPLGGLAPLALMQLGEVIFGGVGSGLYGMLAMAMVAVFVAGLMVGRTPEYVGKKIGPFEVKMASIALLVPPIVTLVPTAIAVVYSGGTQSIQEAAPHGFTEALYAFTSQGNNNGSAFAGFAADTPFVNLVGGLAMLISRFWVLLVMVAVAGAVGSRQTVPIGPGTLPTHTPLFVGLLIGVVLVVGFLTFVPALALGPVAEHLMITGGAGS